MKITIDTDESKCIVYEKDSNKVFDLYSKEAFKIISRQWVKVGWNEKYSYTFSWFGRPIIQLPEDMIRIQEIIYKIKPDLIIETGVAHGGSLIYYASLCKALGKGRVVGIDIEIRPKNRELIEKHELYNLVTLIEGDSTEEVTVKRVRDQIGNEESVLVILDSCHLKDHVLKELNVYSEFVTIGSYIVATDGIMEDLYDTPRGNESWKEDNPSSAVSVFLKENNKFVLETPKWGFNESNLTDNITHWSNGWLKRIR